MNLQPIQPAIFAESVAARALKVSMASAATVLSTAGAPTVKTKTPYRVGGQLHIAVEDVATVGQENFESALRQTFPLRCLPLIRLLLNGSNASEPDSFLKLLSAPAATEPASTTGGFGDWLKAYIAQVDDISASKSDHVRGGVPQNRACLPHNHN